jgi:hypothetical protein
LGPPPNPETEDDPVKTALDRALPGPVLGVVGDLVAGRRLRAGTFGIAGTRLLRRSAVRLDRGVLGIVGSTLVVHVPVVPCRGDAETVSGLRARSGALVAVERR